MLATGITAGTGFNRNDDDAVKNSLGLLGSAHRFFIIDLADGVAAIGDDHHYFSSLSRFQRLSPQKQGIVQGGGSPCTNPVNRMVYGSQIRSKLGKLTHTFAELIKREAVDRPQDGMREPARRSQFKGKVFARAGGGIHGQNDRERERGLLVENCDFLLFSVFLEFEIIPLETSNGAAVVIGDGHEDVNQLNVNFKSVI